MPGNVPGALAGDSANQADANRLASAISASWDRSTRPLVDELVDPVVLDHPCLPCGLMIR